MLFFLSIETSDFLRQVIYFIFKLIINFNPATKKVSYITWKFNKHKIDISLTFIFSSWSNEFMNNYKMYAPMYGYWILNVDTKTPFQGSI